MLGEEQTFLAQELARIIHQFWRVGRQHNSRLGIRRSEFMLLVALVRCNSPDSQGIKISELSTQMQITPAGITHAVNSLEEGGYVKRLADPTDRRVVLVKATAKGEQVVECLQAEHLETLRGLVGFLGEQDSKELIRLFASALTYLEERRHHDGDKSQT